MFVICSYFTLAHFTVSAASLVSRCVMAGAVAVVAKSVVELELALTKDRTAAGRRVADFGPR